MAVRCHKNSAAQLTRIPTEGRPEKELLLVWILHEYAREMHPQKTFIEHESVLLSINPTRGIGNIRGASHGSAVIGGISATEHSIT